MKNIEAKFFKFKKFSQGKHFAMHQMDVKEVGWTLFRRCVEDIPSMKIFPLDPVSRNPQLHIVKNLLVARTP